MSQSGEKKPRVMTLTHAPRHGLRGLSIRRHVGKCHHTTMSVGKRDRSDSAGITALFRKGSHCLLLDEPVNPLNTMLMQPVDPTPLMTQTTCQLESYDITDHKRRLARTATQPNTHTHTMDTRSLVWVKTGGCAGA